MCGIFGLVGDKNSYKQVFSGLKDIEYRGYDSWGISFFKDGKFHTHKEIGFLPSTINFPDSNISIGHTRWATHGGVTKQNAHPHSDCHNKLVLVHNGIVENYLELKQSLKNHKFVSETDSEVIIHQIEEFYQKDKNLLKAVSKTFNMLNGLNAIVVSDGVSIVACKNSSPLVVGVKSGKFYISSDPNSILPYTNKLLFIEDNQLLEVSDILNLYNAKNLSRIEPNCTTVDWKHVSEDLKKFPHFMLKEISEQPKVITNLLQSHESIKKISKEIKKAFGTYFLGCGTAAFSCLSGVYLFSKYAQKHVNCSIGSEFNYIKHYLTPKSLLIAVSQSGETIDIVEPVTNAKQKKSKIVAVTNVLGSSLYRLADETLLLQAGVEKAVASTKAYTAMISTMILLAFYVAGKEKQAKEILVNSAKEATSILKRKSEIKKIADKIYKAKDIFCLGRGLSYPLALEAALKIKEVAYYIHAEGFPGGELKHGPIALIGKGTPVIVFAPNDETREAILANAMEVKARGAYVIGIGPTENPVFDYFFKVKDVGASSILPHIVFPQLLAYYLSLKLGCNPDKPRNLAKSVVVR